MRHVAELAALALGATYVYGALSKAADLDGAGQDVGATLPLIPLEQILIAGIAKGLFLLFVILATAVFRLMTMDKNKTFIDAYQGYSIKHFKGNWHKTSGDGVNEIALLNPLNGFEDVYCDD